MLGCLDRHWYLPCKPKKQMLMYEWMRSGRLDGDWHHIAVTWEGNSGLTAMYFDGEPQKPFWRATGGQVEQQDPALGGVDSHLAWGTDRQNHGAWENWKMCTV